MTEPTEAELLAAFRSAVAASNPAHAREALRERWQRDDRVFAAAQRGAERAEFARLFRPKLWTDVHTGGTLNWSRNHDPNHWG